MSKNKFIDDATFSPEKIEDDDYADLFDGLSTEDAIQLQKEIDAAQNS